MKIGFCGTVSVGKTTLVNALSELPEFKDYITRTERSKYLMEMGIPLNTDSTLKGQCIFLSERVTELFQPNIITDRTVIDVIAFSNLSTSMTSKEKATFNNLASNMISDYDYIFYVSPEGVEIENNGVRETNSEYRDRIDNEIQSLLYFKSNLIKNIKHLKGTTEERIQIVKETIPFQYL